MARRVVVIREGENLEHVVGAGCLVDDTHILTTRPVVERAITRSSDAKEPMVTFTFFGLPSVFAARVLHSGESKPGMPDLALL